MNKMHANFVRESLIVDPTKASSVVQSDNFPRTPTPTNAIGGIPENSGVPSINRLELAPAGNQKTHTKTVWLTAAAERLVQKEVADGRDEQLRRRVHRGVALPGQHFDARVRQCRRQRLRIRVVRLRAPLANDNQRRHLEMGEARRVEAVIAIGVKLTGDSVRVLQALQ